MRAYKPPRVRSVFEFFRHAEGNGGLTGWNGETDFRANGIRLFVIRLDRSAVSEAGIKNGVNIAICALSFINIVFCQAGIPHGSFQLTQLSDNAAIVIITAGIPCRHNNYQG